MAHLATDEKTCLNRPPPKPPYGVLHMEVDEIRAVRSVITILVNGNTLGLDSQLRKLQLGVENDDEVHRVKCVWGLTLISGFGLV